VSLRDGDDGDDGDDDDGDDGDDVIGKHMMCMLCVHKHTCNASKLDMSHVHMHT